MADNVKRAKNYPWCGRLIVLQSMNANSLNDANSATNFDGYAAINFPSMPEVIELARRADYDVRTPQFFPDGIHTYQGTSVQEIPISFKLHAFDQEYCKLGALTLMQLAASLQALILPLTPKQAAIPVGPSAQAPSQLSNQIQPLSFGQARSSALALVAGLVPPVQSSPLPGQVSPPPPAAVTDQSTSALQQNASIGSQTSQTGTLPTGVTGYAPVTCLLELIRTDVRGPGIVCVGYVKDVDVKLFGPFMKGPGLSHNLPSRGEFAFTFVHQPDHTNAGVVSGAGGKQSSQQAYAQTVQDRLYNTANLLSRSTDPSDWRGFND